MPSVTLAKPALASPSTWRACRSRERTRQLVEAAERRAEVALPGLLPVSDKYQVRDGVLEWVGYVPLVQERYPEGHRWYDRLRNPRLPAEFARLRHGDEGAVLAFAHEWGLLGYESLLGDDFRQGRLAESDLASLYARGDPLGWVWAHARTVRMTLDFLKAARYGDRDDSSIRQAIDGYRERDLPFLTYAAGLMTQEPLSLSRFEQRRADPLAPLGEIVEEILNANLRYLGVRVVFRRGGASSLLARSYAYTALLPVIYGLIAEAGLGDLGYHECDYCGKYFRQTDRRQRFCPHLVDPTRESLCALKSRQRKRRQRTERKE